MALDVTYETLLREVGRHLGLAVDDGDWETEEQQLVDDIINSGLRQFYTPPAIGGRVHRWSFMRPVTYLTTIAPYSTGTIAIAAGVVTLTSGTFPTWTSGTNSPVLTVNGVSYPVATRSSGTSITLSDTSVTVSSGASYVLSFEAFDLPSTWGGMDGPLTYRPGDNSYYPPVEQKSEAWIRQRKQQYDERSRPSSYAIRPKAHDATVGARWQILFDPTPDAAYQLTYRYKAIPSELSAVNLYPLGGMEHAETILASVMAVAEARTTESRGERYATWMERLQTSIAEDAQHAPPDFLGQDGIGPYLRGPYEPGIQQGAYVEYEGFTLYGP